MKCRIVSMLVVMNMVIWIGGFSLASKENENRAKGLREPRTEVTTLDESQEIENEDMPVTTENVEEDVQADESDEDIEGKIEKLRNKVKIMEELEKRKADFEGVENSDDRKAAIEAAKKRFEAAKERKAELKEILKQQREALKLKIRESYSDEEKEKIGKVIKELQNVSGISILPYENIHAKGKKIIFDTPPVIKDKRTLIPVRALAAAYGFTVGWDGTIKKVTLQRDNVLIELYIDKMEAIVNGKTVALDVPPAVYSGRTVLPLRFIIESVGLDIHWDEETKTIEIDEEKEAVVDETELSNLGEDELLDMLEGLESGNVEVAPTVPVVPTEPSVPTEPVVPTEPSVPTEPVVPTDPVIPVVPNEPVVPAEPVIPVVPSEPVAPADPVVPVAPSEPAVPTDPALANII